MVVIAATINKQTATRDLMIPLLAKNLKNSGHDEDLQEVFLRTTNELRIEEPAQVPEYRTSMQRKLCLHHIFGLLCHCPIIENETDEIDGIDVGLLGF